MRGNAAGFRQRFCCRANPDRLARRRRASALAGGPAARNRRGYLPGPDRTGRRKAGHIGPAKTLKGEVEAAASIGSRHGPKAELRGMHLAHKLTVCAPDRTDESEACAKRIARVCFDLFDITFDGTRMEHTQKSLSISIAYSQNADTRSAST
jgi:hypothetical protein